MISIKVIASGSTGNAYLLSDRHSSLLIECGIRYRDIQIATDFKTSEIVGCLISHEHKDHTRALKDVLKTGIDCYTSQGTIDAENIKHHRLKSIQALRQFKVGDWTIMPFDVEHDAKEPLGFLIANGTEKILFATDTYYVRYRFNGLTHIMVECNYSTDIANENVELGYLHPVVRRRLAKSHFSLENVKEFLKANDLSKVKEIHLIHLSTGNSDPERFKREIQQLTGKPVYVAG